MKTRLTLDLAWIPAELGGRLSAPCPGMRCSIRWQRYIAESLARLRDVSLLERVSSGESTRSRWLVETVASDLLPATHVLEGELVELLEGHRVVAVGRILAAETAAAEPARRE